MTNPSVAKQGLKEMSDGFKIAMDGMKMIGRRDENEQPSGRGRRRH